MATIEERVHIDDLCKSCGYFAGCEPDTHNGHDYGCDHPDNYDGDKQCFAAACPLGHLDEEEGSDEYVLTDNNN